MNEKNLDKTQEVATFSSQNRFLQNFQSLPLFHQLKKIIEKWWKIQINVTDAQGLLLGVEEGRFFKPCNKVCNYIVDTASGYRNCKESVTDCAKFCTEKKVNTVSVCHAGFNTLTVPILDEGVVLGHVFADGFFSLDHAEQQRKSLRQYISQNHASAPVSVDKSMDTIEKLNSNEVGYLQELLVLMIEEIKRFARTLEQSHALEVENKKLLDLSTQSHGMVAQSLSMQKLIKIASQVAQSDATVLIEGENGVGKEVMAHFIHSNSQRKDKPFVIQNCAAMNDNLLESELFGHVKGSFTGATRDKKGLFELAHLGTLFLDEIGDTSPSMQVKLLRVLQEGTFIPVGGVTQKQVDVRIVAATNKDLKKMVADSTFREDLFYRLNVFSLPLPPLRSRKEDIPVLISRFLSDFQSKTGSSVVKSLHPSVIPILETYPWPGNIRELRNEVHRMVLLSQETEILTLEHVSESIQKFATSKKSKPTLSGKYKDLLEEWERGVLTQMLEQEGGNKSRVAVLLDISRATVITKCQKYGIDTQGS
jgi:transcriptional regulator with PAS, ATPase and Fis domain